MHVPAKPCYCSPMANNNSLKPGDIVTRGAGTARWVVNFVSDDGARVTLVKEQQKSKSGSARWWDVADVHRVAPKLPEFYGKPIDTPSGHKWMGYSR